MSMFRAQGAQYRGAVLHGCRVGDTRPCVLQPSPGDDYSERSADVKDTRERALDAEGRPGPVGEEAGADTAQQLSTCVLLQHLLPLYLTP